ncbi:MAG: radical SAM protein [Clostridia bacterium]|nr:radical SAM protein [Clostridia bacterium]
MKTHRNIPFFVPHAGCPHCCVFCSQVKITGQRADKDLKTELCELRELLDSCAAARDKESRIAFFGGSFTAIERSRMEALLSVAAEYVQKGVASGIRISTRPDCIDGEILGVLKKYGVTDIELGIQSTDDGVLSLCERGHTARDSENACRLVKKHGFKLGGQMMTGLPGATAESEMQTARDIVAWGADEARVYPLVVFEGTKLMKMTLAGDYVPLCEEDTVKRTADCCRVFIDAGLTLLRIGLHSGENLAEAPFGANHPAIGEKVQGRIYADTVCGLAGESAGSVLEVKIRREDVSMLTGFGREALGYILKATHASGIKVIPAKYKRFYPSVKKYLPR